MTAFLAENVRSIRVARGLSLDELARITNVSRQYVHQIETGAKKPSSDFLQAAAMALGVHVDYFGRSALPQVKSEQVNFRSLRTLAQSARRQVIAIAANVELVVNRFEEDFNLPLVDFPEMSPKSMADIERIAVEVREHWGLGTDAPIKNMTRVLERAGAVVTHFSGVSEKADALSVSRRRPIIVRNLAKRSAARLRFDLAHECAHLILHMGLETGDRKTEGEAHRFAGAFLYPAEAVRREFPRSRRINWQKLLQIKRKRGISVAAIIRRARDLNLIDDQEYKAANIRISQNGWRKIEPGDEDCRLEQPELIRNIVDAYGGVESSDLNAVLKDLGIKKETFRWLFAFDDDTRPLLEVDEAEASPVYVLRPN